MSDPQSPQPGWQPPQPEWSQPGTQPYGYPQGAYNAGREHPDGTTILVLGILGLVICQILGPFAWVKGNKALAEIDAAPGAYTNRGSVSAGRICGIVSTAFLALSVIGAIAFLVIAVVAGTSSGGS